MSSSIENRVSDVSPARKRPGFVRRLLADTRGTATTETVIMIPMFAIVWGCIFFVFTFFQRTITMRSMTRGHTWAYSYVGCNGTGPGTQLETTGASQIEHSSVTGLAETILGTILQIRTGHGHRTTSTARPRVIGGGSINMTDDLHVMCNRVPRSIGGYLSDFAGSLLGFGG